MAVYSRLFLQHKIPHAFGAAGELAPVEARHLKQIHGVLTHCADNMSLLESEGDGVFSYGKNICAIKTADCVPILVASKKGNFYAAIHAGWRGICAEIIPKFLQKIPINEKKDLIFSIGPCISWNHFEVGPEVVTEFLQEKYFFGTQNQWLRSGALDKSMIDLKSSAAIQIENCGIDKDSIDILSDCTFTNEKFNSYRRDKSKFEGKVPSNWSWVGVVSPA